jgi:hypothetical protein
MYGEIELSDLKEIENFNSYFDKLVQYRVFDCNNYRLRYLLLDELYLKELFCDTISFLLYASEKPEKYTPNNFHNFHPIKINLDYLSLIFERLRLKDIKFLLYQKKFNVLQQRINYIIECTRPNEQLYNDFNINTQRKKRILKRLQSFINDLKFLWKIRNEL